MSENRREKTFRAFVRLIVGLGLPVIGLAVWQLLHQPPDYRWLAITGLAIVASWVTATKVFGASEVLTVSETFVYLTLLLCGWREAVMVAAITTAVESLRYTKRWVTFATNVTLVSLSLFAACLAVNAVWGDFRLLAHQRGTFFSYALALAAIAAVQSLVNTLLMTLWYSLKTGLSISHIWRSKYAWVMITFFFGMLSAGVAEAFIHLYNFWFVLVTIPVLLANYVISRPYLKNIEAARSHAEELRGLHLRTLEAFAAAVDAKDQITHDHVQRVQIYATGLARLLNLSDTEVEALRAGALLHDIGKIAVPDYILNKPGKLTAAEFDKMKIHTIVGAQILERINFPYPLVPIVRHHHERWDGRGYPDGLKAEAIPITARILTVVDCFDAVREDRQYRKGMTRQQAIDLLRKDRGIFYDPQIVDLFIEHLPTFEAEIARIKKDQHVFTPVEVRHSDALRTATPAAGLAEEKIPQQKTDFVQTIRAFHQSGQELFALLDLAESLTQSLNVDETLKTVVTKLHHVVPCETCAIYLFDADCREATAEHAAGLHADHLRGRTIRPGEGVTGWVLANRASFSNTDPTLDFTSLDLPSSEVAGYRTLAVFPLLKDGRQFGAIAIYSQTQPAYSTDQLQNLGRVANLTASALHNALLYREAQAQATTDLVTGLPNAQSLYKFFEKARQLNSADEHPLTLLMLEVDAAAPDQERQLDESVLKEVAGAIRAQFRRKDVLMRYLGDRFVALLRDTPPETLSEIAARLQTAVAEQAAVAFDHLPLELGVSIGQARLGPDGQAIEQILQAAESRLQADKSARRAFSQFDALAAKNKL